MSLDNCFVDEVVEPIHLIEVDQQQPTPRSRQSHLSTVQDLAAHFDHNNDYACRYISICQRNSWQPLQATRSMLDLIVAKHGISSSIWDVPSCFYRRNREVEEVFCVPYTESRDGSIIEVSYTVRYPEHKTNADQWVIRQTGIYHQLNTKTGQSLYVLFNPMSASKAHREAQEWLLTHAQEAQKEPFWLHRIVFSAYFPAWRQYIASLENEYLPIANGVNVAYVDEPLRIGFENLSTTMGLQRRFLQISTVLAPAAEALDEIYILITSISLTIPIHPRAQQFKNYHRQCISYSRMATHLQQRSQMTAQLLTDTLSFRDQVIAKEQTKNILQLNKSAVFVTFLTLLYLPSSFLTSFFGMNFFAMDQDNSRMIATSMIWIFIVSSVVLTTITFLIYRWRVQRDSDRHGMMLRSLVPRVNVPTDWNLRFMTRRLTSNQTSADFGQKESPA
ncbi:hypothetical protein BGW36DRAFT_427557 [Talaromyces proteolyticus]|uniref:CorA-like transporter domain-containing protein n=1 Tax=Talaromyces proteolyticus TaxID=1131652 RepID=A0AAD4KRG5_9EURO|nr:uncharacterized protein BGW36DRAFT_427557 [Talaromyces proteolyticus]KAH8697601.1 hypothetical protein BGW36DRAFT_427557 [Talaromyces proteolyticus]